MSGRDYTGAGFRPHSSYKTVLIRCISNEKGLTLADGSPLPEIKKGATCQLRVPVWAIKDKKFAATVDAQKTIEVLPTGTLLLAAMNCDKTNVPPVREINLRRGIDLGDPALAISGQDYHYLLAMKQKANLLSSETPIEYTGLAEILILSPLRLKLRGDKPAIFEPCPCGIPYLNITTPSLNNAYTKLSEYFERHRLTHVGNVFERVYFNTGSDWLKLDRIRDGRS